MKPYINYDEFELVCWDTDGEGTNVGIDIDKNQARQICEIIGLIGFNKDENGTIQGLHKKTDGLSLTHINADRLKELIYSLSESDRFKDNNEVLSALQEILSWLQEEQVIFE